MALQVDWTDLNWSDGTLGFTVTTSNLNDVLQEFAYVNAFNALVDPGETELINTVSTNPTTYELTFNPGGTSLQELFSFDVVV